jgi:hypothetical protein
MEALLAGLFALVGEAAKIAQDAQHAKDEQHAEILARVQASRAALAGDKSDAHKAVEAALTEAQSAIDAARK